MPKFILVSLMVAIYLPKLNKWLIRSLALDPFWKSHISIQIIDISDLGDTLITQGLDVRVIPSNKSPFLMKLVMSSLVRAIPLGYVKRMFIILRYDFDCGRHGGATSF